MNSLIYMLLLVILLSIRVQGSSNKEEVLALRITPSVMCLIYPFSHDKTLYKLLLLNQNFRNIIQQNMKETFITNKSFRNLVLMHRMNMEIPHEFYAIGNLNPKKTEIPVAFKFILNIPDGITLNIPDGIGINYLQELDGIKDFAIPLVNENPFEMVITSTRNGEKDLTKLNNFVIHNYEQKFLMKYVSVMALIEDKNIYYKAKFKIGEAFEHEFLCLVDGELKLNTLSCIQAFITGFEFLKPVEIKRPIWKTITLEQKRKYGLENF